MRILLGHVFHSSGVDKWYEDIANVAGDGLEVRCFCVTLNPPGPILIWKELHKRWRQKERSLMNMYARLKEAASECDVFLLYNGANVHPDFLQYLSTFNVFTCFDDPESSANLSAPVAAAFDAVFYGNIASLFQYESWGCKNLAWLPIFTSPNEVPTREEGQRLLNSKRDIEIGLVCEKNARRNRRLEMLASAFPQAQCYGEGWSDGKIHKSAMQNLYRRIKIGWNVHNSTGPVNRRLFTLPAYGVLQVCDNKTGLAQIFRQGEEAVGFDTIPEAIELTRYFLEHEEDRQKIAEGGFHRFWREYQPATIWQRIANQLEEWGALRNKRGAVPVLKQKGAPDVLHFYAQEALNLMQSLKKQTMHVMREFSRDQRFTSEPERDERIYLEERLLPYFENPEMRGVNMAKERIAKGEPFEWPNMLALNWAATFLIRGAKKIVEIGSGTGPFAKFASVDSEREIYCIEEDDFARRWAEKNRAYPNVTYHKHYSRSISCDFDLLVSLDVIEHVDDIRAFLTFCTSLARRAIFSTPNRVVVRGPANMGPPVYPPHVREFSPGEIYCILKQYYRNVSLYHMPDVYVPCLEPMTILTKGTPIIAECREPII